MRWVKPAYWCQAVILVSVFPLVDQEELDFPPVDQEESVLTPVDQEESVFPVGKGESALFCGFSTVCFVSDTQDLHRCQLLSLNSDS